MATRLAALIVCTCLSAGAAHGQTAPNLTRQQRDLLHAVVTAVDAASTQPPLDDTYWRAHVMRASDGSHYVAFSIAPVGRTVTTSFRRGRPASRNARRLRTRWTPLTEA